MPDLKLTAAGDLDLSSGDLAVTDDSLGQDVAQMAAIRLRWHWGEWFLDLRRGVKYRQFVFVKSPDLAAVAVMLQSCILNTPGIVALEKYEQSFDRVTRQLSVTWRATTTLGVKVGGTEVL